MNRKIDYNNLADSEQEYGERIKSLNDIFESKELTDEFNDDIFSDKTGLGQGFKIGENEAIQMKGHVFSRNEEGDIFYHGQADANTPYSELIDKKINTPIKTKDDLNKIFGGENKFSGAKPEAPLETPSEVSASAREDISETIEVDSSPKIVAENIEFREDEDVSKVINKIKELNDSNKKIDFKASIKTGNMDEAVEINKISYRGLENENKVYDYYVGDSEEPAGSFKLDVNDQGIKVSDVVEDRFEDRINNVNPISSAESPATSSAENQADSILDDSEVESEESFLKQVGSEKDMNDYNQQLQEDGFSEELDENEIIKDSDNIDESSLNNDLETSDALNLDIDKIKFSSGSTSRLQALLGNETIKNEKQFLSEISKIKEEFSGENSLTTEEASKWKNFYNNKINGINKQNGSSVYYNGITHDKIFSQMKSFVSSLERKNKS